MRYLFGVLSQQGVSARKQAVLDTWFKLLPSTDKLVFIVGDPRIPKPTLAGDTLTVPCQDGYIALCEKTKWFLRWASENQEFEYIFKCDDDTYVRPERLVNAPKVDYTGFFWAHGDPITGIFDSELYASGGAGYLLRNEHSKKVSEKLFTIQRKCPKQSTIEDMMVGLVVKKLGLTKKNSLLFQPGCGGAFGVPHKNNNYITGHYLTPITMLAAHNNFEK